MRILMVIGQFAPVIGGAERQCALLAGALMARGHTVHVLTVRPESDVPQRAVVNGVPVERIVYPIVRIRGRRFGCGFLALPLLAWRAWRLLAHHDIVIAHQALWPAFAATVAAHLRHRPIVVKIGNSGERFDLDVLVRTHWYGCAASRFLVRHVTRFIGTSTAVRADLHRAGISDARIAAIPNGVVLPPVAVRRHIGDQLRCVFVGTLTPKKDVATFLHAIAVLPAGVRSRITVTIAGDGPLRQTLEECAATHGITDVATFVGSVTDVPALLATHDVFVLPSRTEGLSNAALEAAAAQLPLVLTAAGGNPDLVPGAERCDGDPSARGTTGILVSVGNAAALAGALTWLLEHPAERQRMGAAARVLMEDSYSMERIVVAYEDCCTALTRPRIVHLLTFLDSQTGGMERQAQQLAAVLRDMGHAAFFITSAHIAIMRREHLAVCGWRWGFRVYRIPFIRGWRRWNALVYCCASLILLIVLRRRYDVIHAHQLHTSGVVASIARRFLPGKRVVVKNACGGRDGDVAALRNLMTRRGLHRFRNGIDRFIGISEETMSEMGALRCTPTLHIPNGVRTDRYAPPDAHARLHARQEVLGHTHATVRCVLTVGRLHPQKNLTTLMDAIASLDDSVRLIIVGDGAERAALDRYRVVRGLEQRVRLVGAVVDVLPYYHAADVFALSSRSEGMPNVILEAMACGLPIVASDLPPLRAMVCPGTEGILVDVGDVAGFAAALQSILQCTTGISVMGQRARDRVVQQFSIVHVAQRYAVLYAALCAP